MHLHILGICGTFMCGLAALARELGHTVTGSDTNCYPPMSTQLEALGINLMEGYSADNLNPTPNLVVIGNALSRGNVEVEAVFNRRLPYTSGPAWLRANVLKNRKVIAVAGTHGKTTTSSMIAWALEHIGRRAGFLIGGLPENFNVSARLGNDEVFVVEADEYDSAFFDKRAKFVHYSPTVAVLNNLEFDHADIYEALQDIERQFHYFLRTVPGDGIVVTNADDKNLQSVLQMGYWSSLQRFSTAEDENAPQTGWRAVAISPDYRQFEIVDPAQNGSQINWPHLGKHNMSNALAAVAAVSAVGVKSESACQALQAFQMPKRRLQCLADYPELKIYQDFAHHPTAIKATLTALKQHDPEGWLFAVFEPRSNTMRMGKHNDDLLAAFSLADDSFFYQEVNSSWRIPDLPGFDQLKMSSFDDIEKLCNVLLETARTHHDSRSIFIFMSNGDFAGLPAAFSGRAVSQVVE